MRRRHHRVLGVNRRSAREMEIPHAKLLTYRCYSAFSSPDSGAGLHGTFMRCSAMLGADRGNATGCFPGFPLRRPPDKPLTCRTRSPLSISSPALVVSLG